MIRKSLAVQLSESYKQLHYSLDELRVMILDMNDERKYRMLDTIHKAKNLTQATKEALEESMGELSPQETRVRDCIIKGYSNKQIAQHYNLTEKTVKFHVTNIFKKYGVRTRANLIVEFYQSQQKPVVHPPITQVLKKEIPKDVTLPEGLTHE